MSNHKYRLGQMVDLVPSTFGVTSSGRAYKVLRLLPREGGQYLYRIKTIAEACERIARESELVISASVKR